MGFLHQAQRSRINFGSQRWWSELEVRTRGANCGRHGNMEVWLGLDLGWVGFGGLWCRVSRAEAGGLLP